MIRCQHTSSAPVVLLLALFALTLQPTTSSPVTADTETASERYGLPSIGLKPPHLQPLRPGEGGQQGAQSKEQDEEEDDELFKDVDPKTLAAVLLEALGEKYPQGEKKTEAQGEAREGGEEEGRAEEERELQGADRDRDGRQELELVMAAAAAQGKEEREREEERKRAQEEEERLTEKVTSRTTSQTVPVKEKLVTEEEARQEEVREEARQEPGGAGTEEEEEEQLSPEEVKNLQSMLEELTSYSTASKRQREASAGRRDSRGSYLADLGDNDFIMTNDIKPKPYDLALSKKKLKWQQEQEQEKNKNRPQYRGGNFMDDFDDNLNDQAEEDEDDEDEEVLSPEEEEARAKAEQEEVRRQAEEAQRAKAEEEKLADIASDMLLQYMVKQDGKKYQDQSKKNSLGMMMNAAEDKRSDEEEDASDDDIDPQTIDKLIEISSKLHLPADDVVDIISDVEKKKKKDAPETPPWQRPLAPPAAPMVSRKPPSTAPVAKQPPPVASPFMSWFKDRAASVKPSKQNFWLKSQRPFRTYPSYPFYQKPYRGYYPIYIPQPKPKPRYYAKPPFSLNDLLGNSLDYGFDFSPKRRYRPWAQPRSRTPPALRRNLYFPNYIDFPPPHPRTFKAVPMPKPRSPPRRRPAFYYPPAAPLVTRDQDYYGQLGQPAQDSDEELENFIEKVFMKRPRMFQ